jgi:hypothetical protein
MNEASITWCLSNRGGGQNIEVFGASDEANESVTRFVRLLDGLLAKRQRNRGDFFAFVALDDHPFDSWVFTGKVINTDPVFLTGSALKWCEDASIMAERFEVLIQRTQTRGHHNIVHSLKAPVSRILGIGELLAARCDRDPDAAELLGYQNASARKLRELVDLILDDPSVHTVSGGEEGNHRTDALSNFIRFHSDDALSTCAMVRNNEPLSGACVEINFDVFPSVYRLFTGANGQPHLAFGVRNLLTSMQLDYALFCDEGKGVLLDGGVVHHPAGQAAV